MFNWNDLTHNTNKIVTVMKLSEINFVSNHFQLNLADYDPKFYMDLNVFLSLNIFELKNSYLTSFW